MSLGAIGARTGTGIGTPLKRCTFDFDLDLDNRINMDNVNVNVNVNVARDKDNWDDVATGGGDDSLYQSALMGNERSATRSGAIIGVGEQFGNLSVINPTSTDLFSTIISTGKVVENSALVTLRPGVTTRLIINFALENSPGGDECDGLYPTLGDTEEAAQLKFEEDEAACESLGFDIAPVKKDVEDEEKGVEKKLTSTPSKNVFNEYDVSKIDEEVKNLLDELVEMVPVAEEDESQKAGFSGDDEILKASRHSQSLPLPTSSHSSKATNKPMELSTDVSINKRQAVSVSFSAVGPLRFAKNSKTDHSILKKQPEVGAADHDVDMFPIKMSESVMSEGGKAKMKSAAAIAKRWTEKGQGNFGKEYFLDLEHGHGQGGKHSCHICVPIPEAAIGMLEASIGLSATDARKAAFTLLRYLKDQQHTGCVQEVMKYISGFDEVNKRARSNRRISTSQPEPGNKEHRLRELIHIVARQNCAWGVFEDEELVIHRLNELNWLLTLLDRTSIRRAVRDERYKNYKNVKALCIYFAVEKRWEIQSEVLTTLDFLCSKDTKSRDVILESDFPVDLARAIQQEYMSDKGYGHERVLAYINVLSSLLLSGVHLLLDHLDRMDANFVYCLLQISEGKMTGGCATDIRDAAVSVILAYNMQYGAAEVYDNKVIAALGSNDANYLQKKMLHFILNKDVTKFHNQLHVFPSPWCHMIVKLAVDILTCRQTSNFFYDTDLNIMLAGLSSFIAELEPGDEKRTMALKLTRLILHRLDFQHNGLNRILQTLKGVLLEKEIESRRDQKLAKKITHELNLSRSQMTQF